MSDPKRSLNLFDSIMLVSGSMIGSGIFIVSADMTRQLGSPYWVLACWLLSGLITLCGALSYGELAGMMPQAGGQFIYLKRAFGKPTAFIYGWTVFTVIQTGVIAAVAVAFARFMAVFFPVFDEQHVLFSIFGVAITSTQLLGVASILVLTWINTQGISNGKIIQRVFTSTKILALLMVIVIGLVAGSRLGYWSSNIALPFHTTSAGTGGSGIAALLSAMGVALIGSLFSSDAWNNVTFIAGEIRQPQRNIPLGLLIGVLLVTVLYLLANVAYFMLLPALGSPEGVTAAARGVAYASNDRVGTAALSEVVGTSSEYLMALLIVVSTFGCNNGLILSGARLFQSMAVEQLFFGRAQRLNRKGVPAAALWMQAAWASILCLSGSYGSLLDYCTFASLIFYMVTILALFYLRHKEPLLPRPYRTIGYPVVPGLYLLLAGAICIDLLIFKPQHTMIGLLIMALGFPVYRLFNKQHA